MAAGEDQPQPVVLEALVVALGGVTCRVGEPLRELGLRPVEPRPSAHRVDGLEAAGRDEPRPGLLGDSFLRPALHRRREGVVERLLGEVEVAEEADQGGEDAA